LKNQDHVHTQTRAPLRCTWHSHSGSLFTVCKALR